MFAFKRAQGRGVHKGTREMVLEHMVLVTSHESESWMSVDISCLEAQETSHLSIR